MGGGGRGVWDTGVNRGEEVIEVRQCEETVDLCKGTLGVRNN